MIPHYSYFYFYIQDAAREIRLAEADHHRQMTFQTKPHKVHPNDSLATSTNQRYQYYPAHFNIYITAHFNILLLLQIYMEYLLLYIYNVIH